MRLSDYVIQYLRDNFQVDTIFTVSGGGCIWLIDSLGKTEGVKYVCCHHEQAAAIAAEGYARMTGKLGVIIVTSGPGGTNALTGVLGAYLDSIPMLVISGNVNKELTVRWGNDSSLRQLGDQEFDIIASVKNMTKYANMVSYETEIKYHLDKACATAISGRPGPSWLDIPLDIQSKEVYNDINSKISVKATSPFINPADISQVYDRFIHAKSPLLIVGNGIRLGNAIPELEEFLERTNIPVITAVNGNDIVNDDYEYYCGRFGTHAQIAANTLLDKADFILALGTRLYVRQTGYNFKNFGRKYAYKAHVDIDKAELHKSTLTHFDKKIHGDVKEFLKEFNKMVFLNHDLKWGQKCRKLYEETPTVLDRHRNKTDYVSNYYLIEVLNKHLKANDHIVTSDGGANVVTMQVVKLKGKQRLFTNTGCAAMGYGLPAAVGAAFGLKDNDRLILIDGDGSFHLNIHELQTIKHHNLPIRILLLNNNGYNSIKITQKTMMQGRLVASTPESGVSFPNYEKLVRAYGITYMKIENHKDIDDDIQLFLNCTGPVVCEVFTDPEEYHEPKVMAKIEDGKMIPGNLEDIKWIES